MDADPPHPALGRRRLLVLAGSAVAIVVGSGWLRPGPDHVEVAAPARPDPARHPQPTPVPARRGPTDAPPSEEVAPDRSHERSRDREPEPAGEPEPEPAPEPDAAPEPTPQPQQWGERVTGVRTRLATSERRVALTFDGCGGANGSRVDTALLDHLADLAVPATLFLNARWIEANRSLTRELAREPRYELANHGTEHRPLSVTGRSAYGIAGTASPEEVRAEVLGCQQLLTELTGRTPRWFRSGTAYVDELAVGIVRELGLEVVNYDVLGDAGASFAAAQVERALLGARPGSIALLHLNHPGSGTAAGVAAAVPALREAGYTFVRVGDQPLA